MKNFSIITILFLLLAMPVVASADISIDFSASIPGSTSIAGPTIYRCTGWKVQGTTVNPSIDCTLDIDSSLTFGILSKDLKDTTGQVTSGAGCFYAEDYFVLYFFPDAWGGKSYEFTQKSCTVSNAAVGKAMVMTPVYAKEDQFKLPDGTFVAQGDLTSTEQALNPQLNQSILATAGSNALILKADRARIVRAEYGIPPFPASGQTRPNGWEAIPVSTPAQTGITGTIVFSLAEI